MRSINNWGGYAQRARRTCYLFKQLLLIGVSVNSIKHYLSCANIDFPGVIKRAGCYEVDRLHSRTEVSLIYLTAKKGEVTV